MKIGLIVLGVLVLLVLLVGGQMVGVRNDLTMQKNAIDGAFAQMDVVLQRRADLIPNIVETVKGFATQEKDVIASVANARAALGGGCWSSSKTIPS
jgi:LemA protein